MDAPCALSDLGEAVERCTASRASARLSPLELSTGKVTVAGGYWRTVSAYLISDTFCLLLSFEFSFALRQLLGGDLDILIYDGLLPLLGVFALAYWAAKLYPSIGFDPVEELRRQSLASSAVFLALAASTFMLRGGERYSRGLFLIAWLLSLVVIPLGRALVRAVYAKREWWGIRAVVLGAGKTGRHIVEQLRKQPGFGLRPVAVLDDDPTKQGDLAGVPVLGELSLGSALVKEYGILYGIVAMPNVQCDRLLALLEKHAKTFRHLVVVPDLFGFCTMRVPSRDLGGVLALELNQQLLMPSARAIKRVMDLAGVILGGVLVAPVVGLFALFIKLDSRGPVFFGHTRVGSGGRKFKAWKFRSMFQDADARLHGHLQKHPELGAEWERDFKLKNDPRVTRVGRFLRRTSLDELPQLWNVLKGEMSLVGPRPIVEAEVTRYAGDFDLYQRVLPGMSGLWQVSGRTDTTYAERVALDIYYVRNWSPWLDAYILARTVRVVIVGKGAY